MKLKQNILIATTILTAVICIILTVGGILITNVNLQKNIKFSESILSSLSARLNSFSVNYIITKTKSYLKADTENMTLQIANYLRHNKNSNLCKDQNIIKLITNKIHINNIQVGYYALNNLKTGEVQYSDKKFLLTNRVNKNKFPEVYNLINKAESQGFAEGVYSFDEQGKRINKYAVMYKVPNSHYIVAGILLMENYKKLIQTQTSRVSENILQKEKAQLTKNYEWESLIKSIVLVVLMVILLIFYLFILSILFSHLTRPLKKLLLKLESASPAELDLRIDVSKHSCEEIKNLANSFAKQGNLLKHYVTAFKKSIDSKHVLEHELNIAKEIQTSALPDINQIVQSKEVDVYADLRPAHQVAGDFYDYYEDDTTIYLVIADVSGTGIPAALFMQRAKIVFALAQKREPESPAKALIKANKAISSKNDACMFVTAFFAYYNKTTKVLKYSNAGHFPLMVVSEDGTSTTLGSERNIALGTREEVTYKEGSYKLKKGDVVLFYTDGILDSLCSSSTNLASEKMRKIIKSNLTKPSSEIAEKIFESFETATSVNETDDITLLILRRKE